MKQELIQAALRPLLTVEIAHGHSLVSGATLHDVFISLREKLGERVLVDIVLPTDTLLSKIETIDRTIYFLAGQDGTYTEFGGFVLVDEIALLKKIFDGGWEKLTLARSGGSIDTSNFVTLNTPQDILAAKTFVSGTLNILNPASSFRYSFVSSAITADRQMTLPLLTANDTFVFENHSQTLRNKTINASENTITGFIGGGGTTNFVPKFINVNTLGNSLISDDGATVTIGGTLVNVANRLRMTQFQLGTSAVAGHVLTADASGVGTYQAVAALPAGTSGQTLRHNGTAWVANSALFNDGTNIGIGTTNPQAKFAIGMNTQSGTSDIIQRWNWLGDVILNWGLRLEQKHTGSSIAYDFIQRIPGSDKNVLTFLNGNVGIGTTAPLSRVQIQGHGTTTAGTLNVTASDGVSRFFVRDDGNVGIGNPFPLARLDVNGAGRFNELWVNNPTQTARYIIAPSAISANRTINLPLITADDTFMLLNAVQNVVGQKNFSSGALRVNNPLNSFSYGFVGGAITANRNISLPLLTDNDTLVFENHAQRLRNKTIDASENTITGLQVGKMYGQLTTKTDDVQGRTIRVIVTHTGNRTIETRFAYHTSGAAIGQINFLEKKDDITNVWIRLQFSYTGAVLVAPTIRTNITNWSIII